MTVNTNETRSGSTIEMTFSGNYEDVMDKVRSYLDCYPAGGYGTKVVRSEAGDNMIYTVTVRRYDNCD